MVETQQFSDNAQGIEYDKERVTEPSYGRNTDVDQVKSVERVSNDFGDCPGEEQNGKSRRNLRGCHVENGYPKHPQSAETRVDFSSRAKQS